MTDWLSVVVVECLQIFPYQTKMLTNLLHTWSFPFLIQTAFLTNLLIFSSHMLLSQVAYNNNKSVVLEHGIKNFLSSDTHSCLCSYIITCNRNGHTLERHIFVDTSFQLLIWLCKRLSEWLNKQLSMNSLFWLSKSKPHWKLLPEDSLTVVIPI